jgi:alanine racemase
MSRPITAILSNDNLLHNVSVIQKKAPHSKLIAMVKANAYGHGLRSVSRRLEKHINFLGVASIDEALALRQAGIQAPIILMEGVFVQEELIQAADQGFHVVFHDHEQLQWLNNITQPIAIHAWLKLDTGMGRLGFELDRAEKIYHQLVQHPHIQSPVRVMSHLACADEPQNPLNQQQIQVFQTFLQHVKSEVSLCNSAAIFTLPDCHHDFVRPGITLYGASPFGDKTGTELGLKPVMTLQTKLIAIKHKPKGSFLGYGARFACPEDMVVGVVACGYGDGYPRSAQDGTPVLVNNIRTTLIGQVSMDMMTVDLSLCPAAKVGDPVILWGTGLPVEEVARYSHQNAYDLLTGMQNRVRFEWI